MYIYLASPLYRGSTSPFDRSGGATWVTTHGPAAEELFVFYPTVMLFRHAACCLEFVSFHILRMLGRVLSGGSVVAAAAALKVRSYGGGDAAECTPYKGKMSSVRTEDFPLTKHHHGKAKVRVLKVRHSSTNGSGRERHSVSEYTVHTRLYSPEYDKVFTADNNADLVATDTQKNTVGRRGRWFANRLRGNGHSIFKCRSSPFLSPVRRHRCLSSPLRLPLLAPAGVCDRQAHRGGDSGAVRPGHRGTFPQDLPHPQRLPNRGETDVR